MGQTLDELLSDWNDPYGCTNSKTQEQSSNHGIGDKNESVD